jgi:hypothetical protein
MADRRFAFQLETRSLKERLRKRRLLRRRLIAPAVRQRRRRRDDQLARRDPLKDHLLTPQNAALVLIDYQDARLNSIPADPEFRLGRTKVRPARMRSRAGQDQP